MTRVIYLPSLKTFTYSFGITCLIPSFDQFLFNPLTLKTSCAAPVGHDTESSKKLAQKIFKILDLQRIRQDIDYQSIHLNETLDNEQCEGEEAFIEQIATVISTQKPLLFKLVGFPFKSVNTEQKVISSQPDMAERVALENLNKLCAQIQSLYPPGAHVILLTDGHVFCDVFHISDAEVDAYEANLKTLASDLSHITIQTLKAFLPQEVHYQNLRDQFDRLPVQPINPDTLQLMKDRLAFELKGNHLHLDRLAKTMIHRSQHYASFLLKQPSLASMISLSVHFQKNIAKKIGIYLVENAPITPWHGALVIANDGRASIQYKKDINDQEYQVVTQLVNGIPCPHYRHR